jgi:eukaryotic-like serine/threonine-protein kinase
MSDPSGLRCPMCGEAHAPSATCRLTDTRIGEVLGDKYRLIRLIGQGGMGSVYEAQHALVGRRFAVKLLRPECAAIPEAVARFHREATAVAELESKHIVGVFDFGFATGSPYIVMEYLTGEDCRSALRRAGTLAASRAAQLVSEACKGLEVAHRLGIVHRDLKPENLFIAREPDGADIVKVLDFGIAKLRHRATTLFSTQAGAVMGTVVYMSPEQARESRDVDHRTDIYSLGATLYEMLSGRPPHDGETFAGVVLSILRQEPERLETHCPHLPTGFGDVVHKAMAKDPADRHQSAAELRHALQPYWQTHAIPSAVWDARAGAVSSPATVVSAASGPPPFVEPAPAQPSAVGQTSTAKSTWSRSGSERRSVPPRHVHWALWVAPPIIVAAAAVLGLVAYRSLRTVVMTGQAHPAASSAPPVAPPTEMSASTSAPNAVESAVPAASASATAAEGARGSRGAVRPPAPGKEPLPAAKPPGTKRPTPRKDDLLQDRR